MADRAGLVQPILDERYRLDYTQDPNGSVVTVPTATGVGQRDPSPARMAADPSSRPSSERVPTRELQPMDLGNHRSTESDITPRHRFL